MKKWLLSTTALLALTAAASAADLPASPPPPAPIVVAPVFTWTGFYVGVNAGYGWNANSGRTVFVPDVGLVDVGGNDDGGFVGGGQVGYNYQIGSFVIGAEADIQWSDLGGGNNSLFIGNGFVGGGSGVDWFGTVRARAGVAFDRFLIYATGGFAYATGGNNNGCYAGTVYAYCGGGSDTVTGWTLGGGVEWALPVNWFQSSAVTFGVEGLYVAFDDSNGGNYLSNIALDNGRDLEFGLVRAKLNFKF